MNDSDSDERTSSDAGPGETCDEESDVAANSRNEILQTRGETVPDVDCSGIVVPMVACTGHDAECVF